ncbi:MAG: hypothetical protein KIT83_13700 [Bryobacterales bacterium]|nr:hypothetical protein [Bryobacterales bacterium]
MAFKMNFRSTQHGLSYIYNVSRHVGADVDRCPNLHDDVALVQFLFKEVMPKIAPVNSQWGLPKVTGQFDAVTGFWIYQSQRAAQTRDGVVSPAKGVSYGVDAWLIAKLNYQFKQQFPQRFERLADDLELPLSLRASLKFAA